MTVRLYDPTLTHAIVGVRQITGFSDGTGIKAERSEDSLTLHTGNDGEQAITRNKNQSGTVEFELQQASASNDYLSALMQQHEDLGTGFFPLMIADKNGATQCGGPNCFVTKPAGIDRAKEHGATTWKIVVPKMRTFIGGIVETDGVAPPNVES